MENKKILVIDDDPHLRRLIEATLTQAGALVFTAADGEEGLREFYARQPDLVVLDVMMPKLDGWETCRTIRRLSDVPIIMLTVRGHEDDIVRGLELGADDYITKPFSVKVLAARVQAALRRSKPETTAPEASSGYQDDHLTIDLPARRVYVKGEQVKLTAKEFDLLQYLLENAGRVLTLQQILEHVWGWEYQDDLDYVRVYVWHLRQKIEEDPRRPKYLLTEHGVGYRFEKQKSGYEPVR